VAEATGGRRPERGGRVGLESQCGGRTGHSGADLSQVREREGQGRTTFFYKKITSVGHP
jgi:hypothetical protein